MKIEKLIKETLENLLIKLGSEYSDIVIDMRDEDTYTVNIKSEDATTLIGHHGETIYSLQHVLKTLCWSKSKKKDEFNIILDVDNYRQRQEDRVIAIAEKQVAFTRKTGRPQKLPPMSPYFRRVVHIRLMEPEFDDIETLSNGEGDQRHIIIKPA
ncbi:KH domain-containing protein [Candidatus Peregrinibacteria bacterium]|jgi:spoIIIJ-associated protein|nr:KH domain-containing protein [Candidatus Peregrinibacteria bacterium]MBT4148088.1 KH domain-containing protein [Candidatus Peregrinibacteria bacterium]MBT4365852.1 KH domain-containing protein [Candidatus Peregrinibacteria bacterium]MBT4456458.1 KH domain-containing protein [Candidatus Peregrinibacteria bacterium]